MLAVAAQTLAITAPVFAMLFLGVALKRLRWIDTPFIDTASSLVFRGTMPTLLFLGVVKADLDTAMQPQLLSYFFLATTASFFVAWAWAIWRVPFEDRGIYTQGAFRGNNGIVGLALATSMYGDYGLSVGSLLAALVILCYNVLSAVVLAIYTPGVTPSVKTITLSIVKNPLIIGILSGTVIGLSGWTLPDMVLTPLSWLGELAAPLALFSLGLSLAGHRLREQWKITTAMTALKLLLQPLVVWLIAVWLGLPEMETRAVVLLGSIAVGANVYDILKHDTLVLTRAAVEKLEARFNG